jgi:hypothetical protein
LTPAACIALAHHTPHQGWLRSHVPELPIATQRSCAARIPSERLSQLDPPGDS